MGFNIDPNYLEKVILKSALLDKSYGILISEKFLPEYFDSDEASVTFSYIQKHVEKFKTIPQQEIVINSIDNEDTKIKVREFFDEINATDFSVAKDYEWLFDNTNNYLKDKALKQAILKSIDILDKRGNAGAIKDYVEEALCKDLYIDLGLDYFSDMASRLRRIFTTTDIKVPTYYPTLDEIINGGLPAYTLSVFMGVQHGGKSLIMANMLARQILMGHTGVLFTMEMSQDAFSQRFDSIYTLLDVNKMYLQDKLKKQLVRKLKEIKEQENRGNLYIKEFPTGKATVQDFRIYLRELSMRDVRPSIIYCDYINIMANSRGNKNKQTYEDVMDIGRDLRALSLEAKAPVVSVSQLNREAGFLDLKEVQLQHVSASMGIPSDADFVAILGHDADLLTYASELHYKVSKNRLGGRVGTIGQLFMDSRSLKLYDSTEFDTWINDARITNDTRDVATKDK